MSSQTFIASLRRLSGPTKYPPRVRAIFASACMTHAVTPGDILARDRRRHIVRARREVAQGMRDAGMSLPQIARVLDRDHTAVLNLLKNPHHLRFSC